jgi:hypothetical protein
MFQTGKRYSQAMRDKVVCAEVETLRARPDGAHVTRAALRLHVLAVAHSVHTGHPEFLADIALERIMPDATQAAIELWLAGLWERIDGGYALLDAEFIDHMSHQAAGHHIKSAQWRLRTRAVGMCRRSWRALNSESVIPF